MSLHRVITMLWSPSDQTWYYHYIIIADTRKLRLRPKLPRSARCCCGKTTPSTTTPSPGTTPTTAATTATTATAATTATTAAGRRSRARSLGKILHFYTRRHFIASKAKYDNNFSIWSVMINIKYFLPIRLCLVSTKSIHLKVNEHFWSIF